MKEELQKKWRRFIRDGLLTWTPRHIENWWLNQLHEVLLENKRLKRRLKTKSHQ